MNKPQTKTAGGGSTASKQINVKPRTLFQGDNLDFLRGIDTGTVHLIATDPPFNKNKDFHIEPDKLKEGHVGFKDRWRWHKDLHQSWVDSIETNWHATHSLIETTKQVWGYDMAAFLCWLGVRVMEMHRVLRDDGTLYLHIDNTAHAYVKVLVDSIFGKENFRNEIVWRYGKMGNSPKNFANNHDTILRYTKSDSWTYNPIDKEESEYKVRYANFLTGNKILYGSVKHKKDKMLDRRVTKVSKELARKLRDDDVLFDFDKEFKIQDDVIYVSHIKGNSKENSRYPTQKPLALYEKLIEASSNKEDFVLDPFCGCATTPVASEKLGRQWIGMDLWKGSHTQVLKRLQKHKLAAPQDQIVAGQGVLGFNEIHHETSPPKRTDGGDFASNTFHVPTVLNPSPWQKLNDHQMRALLADAQCLDGCDANKTVCAGCGQELKPQMMHLDHNEPRSLEGENYITNRVVTCSKCNTDKGDTLTFKSLYAKNEESGWMEDGDKARKALSSAKARGRLVRDGWHTDEVKELYERFCAPLK